MIRLSTSDDHGRRGIWLGGLISPGAYLIATQQATAQQLEQSLEELELAFEFNPSEQSVADTLKDESGFIITGLSVESAEFSEEDARIKMSNKLSSPLPTIVLRWVQKRKKGEEDDSGTGQVDLPVYLNNARKQLLCAVKVATFGVPAHTWYQRGVALFASGHNA